MKTIIVLLKAATVEYERGDVSDGDKLLKAAMKLRSEMVRAEKLAENHFGTPKDQKAEKN